MEVTGQLLDGKRQGLLWLLGREHPVERGGGVRFHQKVPGEVQARNHGGLVGLVMVALGKSVFWRSLEGVLPRWFSGKESSFQYRRHRRLRFDLWIRKIPLEKGMATLSSILVKKSRS